MPLLKLARNKTPDMVETAALGLFLHSFYNGIENVMKLIINEKYGKLPSSTKWHKELLDLCFNKASDGRILFTGNLKNILDDYLRFRHFIRNTYSYRVKWELMEDLVIKINENWNAIRTEIVNFIEDHKKQPNSI
jgi:hypothetical protein